MAIYEYQCAQHGVFEALRPMATATASAPCPQCAGPSQRVLSTPRILRASRSGWSAAIERAEKSRHEPEVVGCLPAAGTRRTPTVALTPALQRLPRP